MSENNNVISNDSKSRNIRKKNIIIGIVSAIVLAIIVAVSVFFIMRGRNKVDIMTDLIVTPKSDKIVVNVSFLDPDSEIGESLNPSVELYGERDDKIQLLDDKSLTKEDSSDSKVTMNEVVFANLKVDTEYTVKVVVTKNGYKNYVTEETVTTTTLGTKEDPKHISSVEDFEDIKYDNEGYFILDNDIDLAGADVRAMFRTESDGFKGSIDGNGHTVSNFNITDTDEKFNGLFCYNFGIVKNITFKNVTITSKDSSEINTGILAGYNAGYVENVKFENCTVNVESTAYGVKFPMNVGILAGRSAATGTLSYELFPEGKPGDTYVVTVSSVQVINCKVEAKLTYEANVGLLVGQFATIQNIGNTKNPAKISQNKVLASSINVTQDIKSDLSDEEANVEINVGGFAGSSAAVIRTSVCEANIKVLANRGQNNDGKPFNVDTYALNVAGFVGKFLAEGAPKLYSVAYKGNIDVDAKEVFILNVAGLLANTNNLESTQVAISNSVSKVASLKIKAHFAKPEEKEEGDVTPSPIYKANYSLTVAFNLPEGKLDNVYAYTDINPTLDGNITKVNYATQGDFNKLDKIIQDFIK